MSNTIEIKTPFGEIVTKNVNDLTQDERNALAGLLGFRGAKAEGFKALQTMKKFRKVYPHEVRALCRHRYRFPVALTLEDVDHLDIAKKAVASIQALAPGAQVKIRCHALEGFCQKCDAWHGLHRYSALVTLEVQGIKMSKIYEVEP